MGTQANEQAPGFCLPRNLCPCIFARRLSNVSPELFFLSVLTPRTSGPTLRERRRTRAAAPAVCLPRRGPSADFARVEEQTEPLMEALFPNGMKSSLGRMLHGSAERRDTLPARHGGKLGLFLLFLHCSLAAPLSSAEQLRHLLNKWAQRSPPLPLHSSFACQTKVPLHKMR